MGSNMTRQVKRRLTEAEKEYRREYYRKNKARLNAQMKAWREENRDRHLEMTRQWYVENKEKHDAATAAWSAANLDKKRLYAQRRRERKSNAAGSASLVQIAWRVEYYGGRCAYCGGLYEELDHVIPLSDGGSAWPANLRPSCRTCNRRKFTNHLETVNV